ncbi:MAG: DUF4476 domain-containing protein [Ginsengibacter sp.]
MKNIFTLLLSNFLCISIFAQSTQSVNIIFNDINKNSKNYKVTVAGNSFYSNKNYNNINDRNTAVVDNLPITKHTLRVYRLRNNDPKYNLNGKKILVYTKTFDLRKGHDMDIIISANGNVLFSENSTAGNIESTDKSPMANYDFAKLLKSVNNKWSQALRGETISEAFNNSQNYFSVSQIRQLLTLITTESDRLDLAKLSYRSAIDTADFTQLYDMFKSKASKEELNDFLNAKGWNVSADQNNLNGQMAADKFNTLLQSVRSKWSQALRGETESDAFHNPNNYFTTNQVKQLLSLITLESDRVSLAKLSYRSITDSANFTQLNDLFKSQASKNELNSFLNTKGWNISTDQNNMKAPMVADKFNQLLQGIQNKWSQALKGETESDAFNNPNNYFSSSQVKQLLSLITLESDRLSLAKLSYRSVTDSANFTQLYDLFKSQSSKNQFNAFLRTKGWDIYSGETVVKTPMAAGKFNPLLQNVQRKWSQALKGEAESEAFNNPNNYFSTSQVRQLLTLITLERDRLDLAKLSYRTVVDSANFSQVYDLFNIQESKDELNDFLRTKGWNINEAMIKTPMADADFSQLVMNVRGYLIQILKVGVEREVFNNPDNYFSTNQIRQLLLLINAEDNRLDLAKLAYRTVTDPANFIQLNNIFNLQGSRDELLNYVKNVAAPQKLK